MSSTVYVVDDDDSVRQSLCALIESTILSQTHSYREGKTFLKDIQSNQVASPSCVVLDMRIPGPSGVDILSQLSKLQIQIPVILISGDLNSISFEPDDQLIAVLEKPFSATVLLDAIKSALKLPAA